MFAISKQFSFEAAHHLTGLPDDHPCSHVHGHSYKVILHLRATDIDEVGFVYDYRKLDVFKEWVDGCLDHKYLNEAIPGLNPTAENLARYIYLTWAGGLSYLYAVTVKETEKTEARYEPDERSS